MPLHCSSIDGVSGPSRASGEIARGSSFSRHGSEHLKRRNPSVRTSLNGNVRRGMLQQHPSSQLQTIRASTSLGQFISIILTISMHNIGCQLSNAQGEGKPLGLLRVRAYIRRDLWWLLQHHRPRCSIVVQCSATSGVAQALCHPEQRAHSRQRGEGPACARAPESCSVFA